jgi:hypothetical protein
LENRLGFAAVDEPTSGMFRQQNVDTQLIIFVTTLKKGE